MSSAILTWLILLAVMCVQLDCEIYQDRPKIKTLDGDLILEPALDKNIYLRPKGPKSSIFVGDVDILKANIPKDVNQYLTADGNFDTFLNGPNGILQRLQRLETKETAVPDSTLFNITMLWRRMNALKRRVLNLENRMNSRPRDECDSHPCQHGGTCLNLVDGYHCLCPSNWEGQDCDVDVNECRNFAGTDLGCQNGATCINRPGSYECLCKSNWHGLHCTTKAKDCSQGDFEMCGYGTCIPVTSGEGIKCICHQGWTSNATSVTCLTDINECESYQGPRCSVNPRVDCINLPGSFRCGQCPAGYEGDGYICNDIDECTTIPNGGCSPMVTCHNTIGSRICSSCPAGYQGDGVTCTFRGTCSINHGGCHPSAQCVESLSPTGQASLCMCPEGMDGDGVGFMGCYVSTNNNQGGCEANPCGTHGRCHTLRSGYTCICYKGYSGAHCESSTDACAMNPCQNGGICRRDDTTVNGFRCECTAQYTGSLCQVRSKTCGGILDAEEGSIAYPLTNTSSTYNNDAQCAWVIHTVPDKVINVTFSKFNVEPTQECNNDFLQIHDGRKSSSQLIGRFCGTTFPKGGNFVSNHNNLYFWFHSDGTVVKDGFALHWTSVKPTCGGEVDATTHGHISSPGSPGPYPENRDCYWSLSTTPGKRINLHFFALDIEVHSNCSFDYLAIYDGAHVTDPLLSRYCNSTQPAPIVSAGSELLIHFHSDAYGSGKGFQIAYAPVEGAPGCGGYFTADKGEIVSPTYNGTYSTNLLCDYKIRTNPETKIKLDFHFFKLERSFRCRYDFLKIYDGPSSDSQLVGKFCGTTYPSSYTSSANTLYLKFRTDRSMGAEGFRITYQTLCETILLGDSGVIKSPSYPFAYPENKICVYIIKTVPGKAIKLTFQDFDIEDNRYYNCRYDNVEIRDGPNINSTLLGRYCGGSEHTPPVQISTHNFMFIRFKSDLSLSGSGFYANYTTIDIECGGIYTGGTTGLINHPSGSDATYKNEQSCNWLLIAPEGMHIKLTWNRFEVESSFSCGNDYLEIIEMNDSEGDYSLGKYCGTKTPPAMTTSTNRLKLQFTSDSSIRHAGFSVSYTFLDEKSHCGGNYVRPHGFIYSPSFPSFYEPNRDCTWIITVPVGQQITLNISNFDLERPIRNKCNLGDYLEIRNGASESSPLIGQYCGKFQYKRIKSLANVLHLHFHSDFYLTGTGFMIEWNGTVSGCGGTLTSSSGSISSPNYPNEYHQNSECFYRIVTNAGSRIHITFTELDLEITPGCRDDYLEIYDGRDTRAPLLGKHCHLSTALNIETTSNIAFIKFRSDAYVSAKGFMLNYNTICKNNVTGRYGVIESPDYPYNYPSNLECLWNIQVPKGNTINVTFTHFDVSQFFRFTHWRQRISPIRNDDCPSDYLQMKETSDPNYSKKLCGTSLPSPISTKSNSFQIKFASGYYAFRTGFRLEWATYGCGGQIQKQSGTVSIDRRLSNGKEMECEWLIESLPGKSISIRFSDVYMSESKDCTDDVIEVYNGQNIKSPLISKICSLGNQIIQSDSNYMLIRFKKHSTLRDVHFTSRFQSVESKCGGYIKTESGFLYSKNYPKNYDNDLDCIWYISVPKNHRIELNFVDLDLYSSSNPDDCRDTILIFDIDDFSPASNYTDRICPNSNKTQIVTKYNHIAVQFRSDSRETAKGFKANFTVTCGATILAKHDGIISNNKFTRHSNTSCLWTIVAPTLDQKITLTLTHMSLPKDTNVVTNRNCPSAFLRVLDGNDKDAPLIGEYCGRKVPSMIVSRGNAITIELGSYTDRIAGMFSAHYTPMINACGTELYAEEGTIASPSYPSPYPVYSDCEWIISTSPGNTAHITFERFDLEYSENCNEDYLEIRENDGAGHLLGVYCGNEIPTNYTYAAKIYIKFHSNSKTSGQGFLLHYSYLHENDIEGENGVITSPLYPKHYEGSGEYVWRISTAAADNIALTIDNLEIPAQSDVSYNKLTIYDGYDNTAPVLEQLNGALDEAKIILASSNRACIVLTLDESNTGSKFQLTWTKSSINAESSAPEDRINCGGNQTELILSTQTSELKSPNYPEEYKNKLNCEWIYRTTKGRHLSITFDDFSLEQTPDCFADSVSIYSADTPGTWKPVKQDICEYTTVSLETNASTYMKIKFKTDSSMTKKGFHARVSSNCGGLMTDLSGEFGPLWVDIHRTLYSRIITELKCNWTIKVRPGRTIQLRFSHFNITNRNDNCASYVLLRNGDSKEAPWLESGKYCGYEHEKKTDIETSSNSLFVSYTSTSPRFPLVFPSFKIYYEEKNVECGSTSMLTSDNSWEIINSPSYPNPPVPYSECEWIFSGPPGEVLRIDFISRFDLDYTDNCVTEAVEIRDGSSSMSPLLRGPLCGESPGTIKSSSNSIYIKYRTQLSEPRNGFKANISIDICGGTIIANSGIISSPGYPHMQVFPYGTVCKWRIIGPPRHVFLIKPEDIQFPDSESNCATKLDIEETLPVNNTITILKTICNDDDSDESLEAIETVSNNFTIKLTYGKPDEWDQISQNKGFRIRFNSSRPVCGGRITASEGYLATPSYPQETTLRYCQWLITVPNKSRRIRLELLDINEEKHRINIFDDVSFQSVIQTIPSGNSTLENHVVESAGNKLSVYVWMNRLETTHRFKAKFSSDEEALCGGDLKGISQEIISPLLQRTYTCEWHYNNQVSTDNNQNNLTYNSVFISVSTNSSTRRTQCRFFDPQILITSPIKNRGYSLRREICGNIVVSYRLPSSVIDIRAVKGKTDSLYFNINLKSQPCGGTVHVQEDPVNILNIPTSYNDTLDCAWVVMIPLTSRAEIKMEGSFLLDCDNEYVTITQGLSQDATAIGSYCKGQELKIPLLIHYSYIYVQYHSKAKSNTDIKLIARTVTNQCGGLLAYFQRVFTSPNYPKSYNPNQECAWEIRAEEGYRVSLRFVDRFVVENKPNCTKDAVVIYDWIDDTYKEIARICGREATHSYNSTRNRLKVVFRTDAETNLDGFKGRWEPICGGNYIATEKAQMLYSPGYPYRYHPNLDCSYTISAPDKQKLFIKFLEFELEGTYPECASDNLTLTSQSDYNYLYKIFCGTEIPPTLRNYEKVYIAFKSDTFIQRKGFKLSYSIFTCGGKLNDTSVISTSFGEDTYAENLNCTWSIEAPQNKIIVVKFLYIDMESHPECYNDYVALYDGQIINTDKRLALLCGYVNSTTILRSTGNRMVLEFKSDGSLNFRGFKADVYFTFSEAAGCGGRIDLNTGSSYELKSPLFSTNIVYENFLDCLWSITSPPNTVIKITFTQFHISPCTNVNQTAIGYSNCDCDYVEIKNGIHTNTLIIGKYCGHTFPPQLITSENLMSVRLSTDGENVSSGFKATLTVQPTLCGQSVIPVSSTPYRFKTPGYDTGSIPRGLHCGYHLNASDAFMYNQIRVTVINLQLRSPDTDGPDVNLCKNDKLIISSSWSRSNITTGKDFIMNHQSDDLFSHYYFYDINIHFPKYFEMCGHKEAVDYYVYGSTSINIITSPDSDSEVHKGVEIEVAVVSTCGRNYTESQGRISNSYPLSLSPTVNGNTDCYTLITAPENYTISAYFLNVVPSFYEDNVYLKIYDGDKTSNTLLVNIHNEYDNYPVFSTGRYMLLHTHQNENTMTFDMNYVTTDKGVGCGGKLSNPMGAVTSPFYPRTYRHEKNCEWELETPVGTNLLIRFNDFELGTICDQNHLELVDRGGVVVRSFCSESPADYTSKDNYIKLVFHSSKNSSGKGWSAMFVAIKT